MKITDFRLLIVCGLMAAGAFGLEVKMSIQPPVIDLGGSAVLSIEVRGAKNPSPPALPSVPGLRFVSAGQSQNTSWVNGRSDSFTAFNFQVYPQQTGTFPIGPFDYTADKETKTLRGELKVVPAAGDTAQPQSWSDILSARLTVDRDSAYVQEPFNLTLLIYIRQGVQLAGNINLQGMPETGLSELAWQELDPERDVINDVIYDVRRFRTRTRALASGLFEFTPSVTVQVAVPNRNNSSRGPFDDPFFNPLFSRVETRPVDLPVEKTVLNIKPLPEAGKPAGFGGAVGEFDFKTSAQPLAVRPGDPVTLTMIISGDGNFDRVTMPALPTNGLFRLYGDPVRKQENGTVRFEQVISPRSSGATEIPSIAFSFFDTRAGQYRTVNSPPIPITVAEASNSTAQIFAAKDTVTLPPPETPFATESELSQMRGTFTRIWDEVRPWLWTVPSALLLAVVLRLVKQYRRRQQMDTARIRRQKAPKAARTALKKALLAARQGNVTSFYDALWCALADYFGHRLNLQPGAVTPDTVLRTLENAKAGQELICGLHDLFHQVDACRYGRPAEPVSPEAMKSQQARLEELLKQCEKIKLP